MGKCKTCRICGTEYNLPLCPNDPKAHQKPRRKRPTDTERLTWLLKKRTLVLLGWTPVNNRTQIDGLMRQEAKRG